MIKKKIAIVCASPIITGDMIYDNYEFQPSNVKGMYCLFLNGNYSGCLSKKEMQGVIKYRTSFYASLN